MKIIHVTPSYKPAAVYGGTVKSIALLCEMLAASGQHVEVLTTTANGETELPVQVCSPQTIEGVQVTYFNRLTRDHTHLSPGLLWHLFRITNKSDEILIVHIHSWWNLTSLLACLIAKMNRVPVILSPRGMLTAYTRHNRHRYLKSIIHHFLGQYLLRAIPIHATTEQEKQDIIKMQKSNEITVIPNLMEDLPISEAGSPEQEEIPEQFCFNILFLSRVEEKKGLDLLLLALAAVQFNWRLRIAGDGKPAYISNLQKLSSELGIATSVEWLGHVDDRRKYHLLRQHDLLALFSHNENFANTVTESLFVGTPVAISDQVGLAPFVLKNDLGWVADLKPSSIAEVLQTAWIDTEKRSRIRQSAPGLIRAHFSTKGLLTPYLNLYLRS